MDCGTENTQYNLLSFLRFLFVFLCDLGALSTLRSIHSP